MITVFVVIATLGVGAAVAAPASAPVAAAAGGGGAAATGTLALRATFRMQRSRNGECPPGTPSTILCNPSTGQGTVRGLGTVSEAYLYVVDTAPTDCPSGFGGPTARVPGTTARFTVAGKGEIFLAVDASPDCHTFVNVLTPTRPFTITGGAGRYNGASGSGTVRHVAVATESGLVGTDTWVGTLVVPGLDFDVTAPTLSGAAGRIIRAPRRAKRVRVGYNVTARDAVDGSVRVSCTPRSRSLFRIGRTVVTCSATDTSGNARNAKFTVTVRARR